MSADQQAFFYAVNDLGAGGRFNDERLESCIDRHRIELTRPTLHPSNSLYKDACVSGAHGLIIEMVYGWPNRIHLRLANSAIRNGLRVWFYWPLEKAVEYIDPERYASYRRLWFFVKAVSVTSNLGNRFYQYMATRTPHQFRPILKTVYGRFKLFKANLLRPALQVSDETPNSDITERVIAEYEQMLDRVIACAKPIPLPIGPREPSSTNPIDGVGIYLRTDYWAPINTGGSYGHTCYVAKELAAITKYFVCFMSNRFALLDELGLEQRVVPSPSPTSDEKSLIRANGPYFEFLSKQISQLQSNPAYIYERACLGNFVGARLSQEYDIPYVVEYNGSEISMRRSFDSGDFEYEHFFLKAEEAAFSQASLISVISEAVRDDLLRRGIAREKIIVNPNGVDLQAYAPMEANVRMLLRRELGFTPTDRVVGFIGTFGGWHGIDVLSEAIPQICHRSENVRFLLVGDGNFKHLIDDSISKNKLSNRVVCTGRVPHQRGAQLLGACDIYVSPHSSHMVDSRFFGSPTKLFEYMAMGGGIVASDLEQIGEVLSPALRAGSLVDSLLVTHERSVLCTPGSVAEFVDGVAFLAEHPEVCGALGRNAREAAEVDFSWHSHIARLWHFASDISNKRAAVLASTNRNSP